MAKHRNATQEPEGKHPAGQLREALTVHGALWQGFGGRQRRIRPQVGPAVKEQVMHFVVLLLQEQAGMQVSTQAVSSPGLPR